MIALDPNPGDQPPESPNCLAAEDASSSFFTLYIDGTRPCCKKKKKKKRNLKNLLSFIII